MRKLFFAILIGASLSSCSDSVESFDSSDTECPATPYTRKRVIKPLHGSAVYVENVDTAFRPLDTIIIHSRATGRITKAVVIR